jgi:hypothetical protein
VFGGSYMAGNEPIPFSMKKDEKGEFGTQSPWSTGPFILTRSETSGQLEVRLRVNKDINFIEWRIESLKGFLNMSLEEFVYEYVNIGVGLDFSSRYNEVRLKTKRG